MPTDHPRWSQTVPPDWLPAIDAECERLGISRSELVRRGILRMLPKDQRKQLSDMPQPGRPRSTCTDPAT